MEVVISKILYGVALTLRLSCSNNAQYHTKKMKMSFWIYVKSCLVFLLINCPLSIQLSKQLYISRDVGLVDGKMTTLSDQRFIDSLNVRMWDVTDRNRRKLTGPSAERPYIGSLVGFLSRENPRGCVHIRQN